MAGWADVRRLALALPEAEETTSYGTPAWRVRKRLFVWDRPLREADRRALGAEAPAGPVLGARVEDLETKEALVLAGPGVFFTVPHFDGYPAVLVRLDRIGVGELAEVVEDAWLARAPAPLVRAHLVARPGPAD